MWLGDNVGGASMLSIEHLATAAISRAECVGAGCLVVDDLLPEQVCRRIADAFPQPSDMIRKADLKERKSVQARMGLCDPAVSEAVFAFQHPDVVEAVSAITGVAGLQPDPNLYAGGISSMQCGDYLRPHLDNSHDRERKRWRALNLLYYVSPDWAAEDGGHLQLWPQGVSGDPITIECRFNRLVIMPTDSASWHSVSEVRSDKRRLCVSNYFFTDERPVRSSRPHLTTFRAEPGQPISDLVLRADGLVRDLARRVVGQRPMPTRHINA